jgi:hypothetical protein
MRVIVFNPIEKRCNLCLAALVFGQLASGEVVHRGQMVLGVAFWVIIYMGAFSMSLDRNKLDR